MARNNSVILNDIAISTISKFSALVSVGGNTIDTSILVIHCLCEDGFFGLFDTVKNVWLAIVISVGTHTKEDFSGVSVLLEGIIEPKDGVSRSLIDASPEGGEGANL